MEDLLIDLVFKVRALWDKRHKQHYNKHVQAREWKKIASQLGVGEAEATTCWKNLRQEFGKQLQEFEGKSGDAAPEEAVRQWPFFEKLQFLKDQFTPRPSTGNLTAMPDSEEIFTQTDNDNSLSKKSDESDEEQQVVKSPVDSAGSTFTLHDTSSSQGSYTPQSSSPQNSSSGESITRAGYRKRLSAQATIGKELIDLEREKLELAKSKRTKDLNDEDFAFFDSIIPTVKKLSPKDKLVFRMKIQQLLFKLSFQETPPAQTQTSSTPSTFNPQSMHFDTNEGNNATTSPGNNSNSLENQVHPSAHMVLDMDVRCSLHTYSSPEHDMNVERNTK